MSSYGVRKLESMGTVWHCLCDPTFDHFGTIPACDRQKDTQPQHTPQQHSASR